MNASSLSPNHSLRQGIAAAGFRPPGDASVQRWLILSAILVLAMIVLGGYTRLSQSGLSMVDWHLVTGIVPPLTEAQWRAEFENYQRFPEFQLVNSTMSLGEFKHIFWVEYAHRLLGRVIGLVFMGGLLWFGLRAKFDAWMKPRVAALLLLGAAQGLLGWYMVKSGLIDQPRVSQYRLTAHLSLAVLLYGYLLWLVLHNTRFETGSRLAGEVPGIRRGWYVALALIAVMIVSGGFMAGTKAGYVHNTFPSISGEWLPASALAMRPPWLNVFENVVAIQVIHRYLATAVVLLVVVLTGLVMRREPDPTLRRIVILTAALVLAQYSLGVVTLLLRAPLLPAATHQFMAMMVLSAAIVTCHRFSYLMDHPQTAR